MFSGYAFGSAPLGTGSPLPIRMGDLSVSLGSVIFEISGALSAANLDLNLTLDAATVSSAGVIAIDAQAVATTGAVTNLTDRTNYIFNSALKGAVLGTIGSGGALPTYMGVKGSPGINFDVVGIGVDTDGDPYVDVRMYGTNSGTGQIWTGIYYQFNNQSPAVAFGDIWTFSATSMLLAGTAMQGGLYFIEYDNSGNWLTNGGLGHTVNGTKTRRVYTRKLTQASVGKIGLYVDFGSMLAGQSCDVTQRIYPSQLERGDTATAQIMTTNGPITAPSGSVTTGGATTVALDPVAVATTVTVSNQAYIGKQNFIAFSDLVSGWPGSIIAGTLTSNGVVTGTGPSGETQVREIVVAAGGVTIRFGTNGAGKGILNGVPLVGSIEIRTSDGSAKSFTPDVGDVNSTVKNINGNWQRIEATSTTSKDYRFFDMNLPAGTYQIADVQLEYGTTAGPKIKTGAVPDSMIFLDPVDFTASGGPVPSADLNIVLDPVAYDIQALNVFTGVLDKTLDPVLFSSTGIRPTLDGSMDGFLGSIQVVASAAVAATANFIDNTDDAVIAATSQLAVTAAYSTPLDPAMILADMTAAISAVLSKALDPAMVNSTVGIAIAAVLDKTLDPTLIAAASGAVATGDLASLLDYATFAGAGQVVAGADLNNALGAVTFASSLQVSASASLNKTLDPASIQFYVYRVVRRVFATPRTLRASTAPVVVPVPVEVP